MNNEYYSRTLDKLIKFNFSDPDPNRSNVHFTFGTGVPISTHQTHNNA